MNVRVEDISSTKKKLIFEVAAEKVNKEIGRAFKKIGKTAKVKGFRAGKVPESVLEQYYGPQMEQEVLTRLINDTFFAALQENDIPAVGEPNIVDSSGINKGETFTYEAEVEIKPDIVVQNYTGLDLDREVFDPDSKVVESRLEEMRASRAQLQVSDHDNAQQGDSVIIDFEGFIEGSPFAGGKAEDYLLELGSGSFIPGFEDQILGMKRNETKEIAVEFPESYGQKELAGKPAVFKVNLKEIKEKVIPELDDEFAKGFGLESLESLTEELQKNYETQEKNRIENELRETLVKILIERNPVEVPEAMVAKQLDYMYDNITKRMQSQGMSVAMLGITPENFRENYHETAQDQVRGNLILEAIGRQEAIEANEGEIDAKLEDIASMANAPLETVRKYYAASEARTGLLAQIKEEKVINFLLDNATIKDVKIDPDSKKPEPSS